MEMKLEMSLLPADDSGRLDPLVEKLGGVCAVAKAIPAAPQSIREWNSGKWKPSAVARERLAELAAEHDLEPPFESTALESVSRFPSGPLAPLVQKCGGPGAVARAAGVCASDVVRWNRGVNLPVHHRRVRLAKLAEEHGLAPPFETALSAEGRWPAGALIPLTAKMGSLSAIARALGVESVTVRGWNFGRGLPRTPQRERLAQLAAEYGLEVSFPAPSALAKESRPTRRERPAKRASPADTKRPSPSPSPAKVEPRVPPGKLHDLALKVGGLRALARAAGVSEAALLKWHRGHAVPSRRRVARLDELCEAHGVAYPLERHPPVRRAGYKDGPMVPLVATMGSFSIVASALQVPTGMVSRWNRGHGVPDEAQREALAKLAARYGMKPPVVELVTTEEGQPPQLRPLALLAEQMGGMTELAKAMGVTIITAYAWNRGKHEPEHARRVRLAELAAKHGLAAPFPLEAKPAEKPLRNGPMASLAERLGGPRAMADAAGVRLETVKRWNRGEVPQVSRRRLLAKLAKREGLAAPFSTRGREERRGRSGRRAPSRGPKGRAATQTNQEAET